MYSHIRYCGVNVRHRVRTGVVCERVPTMLDKVWDPLYQGVERVVRTTLNQSVRWPVYEAFCPAERVNELEC